MNQDISMASNGRLVIPAQLRARLGMEAGGTFLAQVDEGGIRLAPLREVISRVQANVRRYVPAGTDLSGELRWDRRHDTAGE
jgi:AbrB family looped-hinge helix DNA binding protein